MAGAASAGDEKKQLPQLRAAVLSCPNCGAEVAVDEGEAAGGCDFCGSKLVRREFTLQDELPDLILPFRLTPEQAKDALKRWAKKQKGKNRKKVEKTSSI